MAQRQKAFLLLAKQGKVEVGTRPIPSPQGEQALVKVTAAASKFLMGFFTAGIRSDFLPQLIQLIGRFVYRCPALQVSTNFAESDRRVWYIYQRVPGRFGLGWRWRNRIGRI
jgi:hypothetical protein